MENREVSARLPRLYLVDEERWPIFVFFPGSRSGERGPDRYPTLPLHLHGGAHPGRLPHLHQPRRLLLDEQEGQIRLHGHRR